MIDIERFRILAESYGGDITRWPEADRVGAKALAKADARAAQTLAEWAALDDALHEWRIPSASASLRETVLAGAPSRGRRRARAALWANDLRLWFAGAGLAAGLAGVFCGAVLSTVAVREARDEALVASAVSDNSVALIPTSDTRHRL